MKKLLSLSFILLSTCFSAPLVGMFTIIATKGVAKRPIKPLQHRARTVHANPINSRDYGIEPHYPYSSLISPADTAYYIKKFFTEQSSTTDLTDDHHAIASQLLYQAKKAEEIHHEMDSAIIQHNNNPSLLKKLKKLIHCYRKINAARFYIKDVYFKDDNIFASKAKRSWHQMAMYFWHQYKNNQYNKKHCAEQIIGRKMPMSSGVPWRDSFNAVSDVIKDNKEHLNPHHNVSYLTHHFIRTEEKDLNELRAEAKKLEQFVTLRHKE